MVKPNTAGTKETKTLHEYAGKTFSCQRHVCGTSFKEKCFSVSLIVYYSWCAHMRESNMNTSTICQSKDFLSLSHKPLHTHCLQNTSKTKAVP